MRGGEQRFRAPANRATDVLLRTHCGEISPLSRRIPLSLSSVHATKLPFDVKQPNGLSLRPLYRLPFLLSLSLSHFTIPFISLSLSSLLYHTRLLHLYRCGRFEFPRILEKK